MPTLRHTTRYSVPGCCVVPVHCSCFSPRSAAQAICTTGSLLNVASHSSWIFKGDVYCNSLQDVCGTDSSLQVLIKGNRRNGGDTSCVNRQTHKKASSCLLIHEPDVVYLGNKDCFTKARDVPHATCRAWACTHVFLAQTAARCAAVNTRSRARGYRIVRLALWEKDCKNKSSVK